MCAHLYLNGDGIGKETHVSLFFIMKGPYDPILPWPFPHRVTMQLLDQSGQGNHIQQTFEPDPNSCSFKQPRSEMNVASGFPRFISLAELGRRTGVFIKDNTMFIRIAVECIWCCSAVYRPPVGVVKPRLVWVPVLRVCFTNVMIVSWSVRSVFRCRISFNSTRLKNVWNPALHSVLKTSSEEVNPDGYLTSDRRRLFVVIWGSFYIHSLTEIRTWLIDNILYSMWDVITHSFPNMNGGSLKQTAVEVRTWMNNQIPLIYGDAFTQTWHNPGVALANI